MFFFIFIFKYLPGAFHFKQNSVIKLFFRNNFRIFLYIYFLYTICKARLRNATWLDSPTRVGSINSEIHTPQPSGEAKTPKGQVWGRVKSPGPPYLSALKSPRKECKCSAAGPPSQVSQLLGYWWRGELASPWLVTTLHQSDPSIPSCIMYPPANYHPQSPQVWPWLVAHRRLPQTSSVFVLLFFIIIICN